MKLAADGKSREKSNVDRVLDAAQVDQAEEPEGAVPLPVDLLAPLDVLLDQQVGGGRLQAREAEPESEGCVQQANQ